MLRQEKFFLFFIIIITAVTITSCEEYVLSPDIPETELIGTWNLTKILASYPSGKKTLSPSKEKLEMIITLKNDHTYNRMQNDRGNITTENGNWKIEKAILILISPSGTYSFPCRMDENILQTSTTIIDPDNGNMLPVTLEFTKE